MTETEETKNRARARRYSLPALLAVCRLPAKLIDRGITPGNMVTMGLLRQHGNITMSKLAEMKNCRTAAITLNIDRLEKLQYVRRVRDPEDRRSYFLQLTELGEGVMEEMVADVAVELEKLIMEGF